MNLLSAIDTGGGGGIGGISNDIHVRGGSVIGMGNIGISVGHDSSVREVTVSQSGGFGINAGVTSLITSNVVETNGDTGIRTAGRGSTTGNAVGANGGDRIQGGGVILENHLGYNVGFGLRCLGTFQDGYGRNVLISNQAGTLTSGCTDMGGNVCNGSLTCP